MVFKLLLVMMAYYNGHTMKIDVKYTTENALRVIRIYSTVLLQNKLSVFFLWILHCQLEMQSEVLLIYSECVTEACKACKAGSSRSSQAEEKK